MVLVRRAFTRKHYLGLGVIKLIAEENKIGNCSASVLQCNYRSRIKF